MDKYTDRALLVMLTLGLCVYMNTTITNPSMCMVCFVYKWACMHKVYICVKHIKAFVSQMMRDRVISTKFLTPEVCAVNWQFFPKTIFEPFLAAILNFYIKRKKKNQKKAQKQHIHRRNLAFLHKWKNMLTTER